MKEWQKVGLGECIDFLNGYAFKSSHFTTNKHDLVLIKGENLGHGKILWEVSKYWNKADKNKLSRFVLRPRDIVLAMDRPWVGGGLKFAYIKEDDPDSVLVQRVGCIRAKNDQVCQEYLRYVIASNDFALYIKNIMGGVAVPHISPDQVKAFRLNLPPLPTQQKIADILSAYDDLIENNLQRIRLLEELAQRTYEEWFVRFRVKGEDLPIDPETGLPKGWRTGQVHELFTLQRGFDLPSHQRRFGLTPIISSTGQVGCHDESKVKAPGVVTGRSGTIGVVNLVHKDFWPLNTALWIKKYDLCGPYFAYFLLKSMNLDNLKSGSAVPSLDRNVVHAQSCVVPDKGQIRSFEAFVEQAFNLIWNLQSQNRLLKEARDILLPRLMNGEIEV